MSVDEQIAAGLAQPGEFHVAAAGTARPRRVVHRNAFTHTWPLGWVVAGREHLGLTLVELATDQLPIEDVGRVDRVERPVHRRWRLTLRDANWVITLPDTPAHIRELAPPWLRDEPVRFMFGWESRAWDVRLVVAVAELPPGQIRPATFEFSGEWWVDFTASQRDVMPYQGNGRGHPR